MQQDMRREQMDIDAQRSQHDMRRVQVRQQAEHLQTVVQLDEQAHPK
jgi:hypothetical protein